MTRARIFMNNKSQAVRLPKAVALPQGTELVDVVVVGRSRIISPAGASWDHWFDGESASEDFMSERSQPGPQLRGDF